MATRIDRAGIEATYAVVKPYIRATPVLELSGADFGLADFPLLLKLEHLQHAGSFKTRGAFANLLTRDIPPAGVVAWYAGSVRVIGVEPEGAPTLAEALKAGRPVDAETGSIAADSLAPRRV